jgi:hypothetical protein
VFFKKNAIVSAENVRMYISQFFFRNLKLFSETSKFCLRWRRQGSKKKPERDQLALQQGGLRLKFIISSENVLSEFYRRKAKTYSVWNL